MIANVHEAKSQLSKLLDAVERGEEVVITRRGSGVGRFQIVAVPQQNRDHMWGALAGQIRFSDDNDLAEAHPHAEVLAGFDASVTGAPRAHE